MSSTYGKNIKISVWGQSHSKAIGVTIDGIPAGVTIDTDEFNSFMARRAPGQGSHSTSRKESDIPEFLSGLVDNTTCGAPINAVIFNKDAHSSDYNNIKDIPRPGHADYTAQVKYGGFQDVSGGGHFSGRLTAPLCIAGGICIQILKSLGIEIKAQIKSIGTVSGTIEEMYSEIERARQNLDSVGGIIECTATGVPAGLGEPMFDGMENRIAQAIFAIPAVKGIEFGNGFESSKLFGSQNNDEFYIENETVKTKTNNHGGILGGITSSMPINFSVAIKPTPSILKEQNSISFKNNENAILQIKGRHDPCIVPRAVPCVEAVCAIALYDALLDSKIYNYTKKEI